MKISKEELLAKEELGTYFEGLCDASRMTKKELERAIDIITNAPVKVDESDYFGDDN